MNMSEAYAQEIDGSIIVRGNTYPYKDELKRLGFRWKSQEKCWRHPSSSHMLKAQVSRLLGSTPNSHPSNIHFHSRESTSRHEDDIGASNYNVRNGESVGNASGVIVHFLDDDSPVREKRVEKRNPSRFQQSQDFSPPIRRQDAYQNRPGNEDRRYNREMIGNGQYSGGYPGGAVAVGAVGGGRQRHPEYYGRGGNHRVNESTEVYVDQAPSVHLEVYCPSDDDYDDGGDYYYDAAAVYQ